VKLFVSYAHDDRTLCKEIYRYLIDIHEPWYDKRLIGGQDWETEIWNRLEWCEAFIFLLSHASVQSEWCERECNMAFSFGKPVIPVLIQGRVKIPTYLEHLQYVDLTSGMKDITGLLNAITLAERQTRHVTASEEINSLNIEVVSDQYFPVPPNAELNEIVYPNENISTYLGELTLPDPFRWVEIPAGEITTEATNRTKFVDKFEISKYPITNAQFQAFVDAGGYEIRRFWLEQGWVLKEERNWTKPVGWRKGTKLDHPVVGLSWFEAKAFCVWLTNETGASIELPTGPQWQLAAQGNTNQKYPWGNLFITTYCNHNDRSFPFTATNRKTTTPVSKFDGKAESLFGVSDMIGNVWEWCSSPIKVSSHSRLEGMSNIDTPKQPVRGGSWQTTKYQLSIHYVELRYVSDRKSDQGFRIIRL
jgi:formylglycine-generating enzyme required for sulfatase activity